MTSPSLADRFLSKAHRHPQTTFQRVRLPLAFFLATIFSTTTVGMRYMHNFRAGNPPLANDMDLLPFGWVFHHLPDLASGLPFSLTLAAILLAHEFGHYFACQRYAVRSTLPYLLPAPSLSGTFGAVIRIKSAIPSRAALVVIGGAGPIAGFIVALVTVTIGLDWSRYSSAPTVQGVAAPLAIGAIHLLMRQPSLTLIVPHPVLTASWIGLLVTALNLIPAGQLDGGHILYAISPIAHRWSSRIVIAGLLLLAVFSWAGWLLWAFILMMPAMRHPRVVHPHRLQKWHYALVPICVVILLVSGTLQPFAGFSLYHLVQELQGAP